MRKKIYSEWLLGIVAMSFYACHAPRETANYDSPARAVSVPVFNSDTAFSYVARQVAFGPRVPNSAAHRKAGDYLMEELKRRGATVIVQEFEETTFDHQLLKLRNIIGSFNPDKQKRILLAAHWDTRPFADKDSIQKDAPFEGANDGASGVGVLLEVARSMGKTPPSAGIDIIFFDGEDWGEKDADAHQLPPPELNTWWCLGSQYWAKHLHKPNYSAYYGILLDMVGAKGAHFFREGYSQEYAPSVVSNVWGTAERLGYGSSFVPQNAAGIIDDHKYINEMAKIPMADIVPYQPGVGYFGSYHHTRNDNLALISKETLSVVGTVLMNVVYREE